MPWWTTHSAPPQQGPLGLLLQIDAGSAALLLVAHLPGIAERDGDQPAVCMRTPQGEQFGAGIEHGFAPVMRATAIRGRQRPRFAIVATERKPTASALLKPLPLVPAVRILITNATRNQLDFDSVTLDEEGEAH